MSIEECSRSCDTMSGHCAGKSFWHNPYICGGIITAATIVLIVFGNNYKAMEADRTEAAMIIELAKSGKGEEEIQQLLLSRKLSPEDMQKHLVKQLKARAEQSVLAKRGITSAEARGEAYLEVQKQIWQDGKMTVTAYLLEWMDK